MKVKIKQEKRKAGLLGGKLEWQTTMTITASEEEKAIVSENVIGEFTVLGIPMFAGGEDHDYNINDLFSREILATSQTKWHANEAAQKMKGAAATIKSLIEETMADETGEFEF